MLGYKTIFGTEVKLTYKSILLLGFLALFPNILGTIHIVLPFGFRVHLFQILIFLAAIIYGPFGGAISGGFGSVYTAVLLNNPYIIIGNMILGFFVGFFLKKGFSIMPSVLLAYAIQLPWLIATDLFVGMQLAVVEKVVVALFISNLVWAYVAGKSSKYVKRLVE